VGWELEETPAGWNWSCYQPAYGAASGTEPTRAQAVIELVLAEATVMERPYPSAVQAVMREDPERFAADFVEESGYAELAVAQKGTAKEDRAIAVARRHRQVREWIAEDAVDVTAAEAALTRIDHGSPLVPWEQVEAETEPAVIENTGPLAWLAHLDVSDHQAFLYELVQGCLADGHETDIIAAWRATAEAYADPGIRAALDGTLGDYGPVPEPPAAGED